MTALSNIQAINSPSERPFKMLESHARESIYAFNPF